MFAVWEALYELPPQKTVAAYVAAGHHCLGAAVGSDQGYVVLATRAVPVESDPLFGFRPVYNFAVGCRVVQATELTADLVQNDRRLVDDPTMRRMTEHAGSHRVFHDPDPRLSPALRDTIDAQYWSLRRLVDRVKLVHALDEHHELHVGFDRTAGMTPFEPDDELFEALVRGLGPWARRIALLHGECPGMTPLAARERDALCLLLGELPQKQYGEALGLSDGRARELVRLVYSKLRITTRAELMLLWSGPPRSTQTVPVVEWRDRVRRRATKNKA